MVNPHRVVNFKTEGLREPELTVTEQQLKTDRQRWREETELTLGRRRHLLLGQLDDGMDGYSDLKALCRAWDLHGGELLKEWSHRVGQRPAGYWLCEFPHHLEGDSTNPLHFGKVVPALADQAAILALHDLLSDAELEAMGQAAQTV